MNPSDLALVWYRQDLRLADHPALTAALRSGAAVLPVFIWAPDEEGAWAPGGASRWWWHQSLSALDASLRHLGARLIVRSGPTLPALQRLIQETGAKTIYWNRRYEPEAVARDVRIKDALLSSGVHAESFNGALLHEPWTMQTQAGRPFQVFTPFWRACRAKPDPPEPLPPPKQLRPPASWPASQPLAALALEPSLPWAEGFRAAWQPGEAGAREQLQRFVRKGFADYAETRNRPDLPGTSRLSPHLHFGELSPRQIWTAVRDAASRNGWPVEQWRDSAFLSEVGWREFAHHLLFHFPRTCTEPLRTEFQSFPWKPSKTALQRWQKGQTGFPIVDAGQRELWATGWMHNRVRMISASFLVKDLLQPWTEGARWFWDTLVDADLAQNTLGWQWTAGCGADAAPYFRVFNPTSQGQKFDPQGDYIRRWCPELARLPADVIHDPATAAPATLRAAGVTLGQTYPKPMVDHAEARKHALAAWSSLKRT